MKKALKYYTPEHVIVNKILIIRGEKRMMDKGLAELYNVPTSRLNEQVKLNIRRFPEDFMFRLNKKELENWKPQIAISNREKMGIRNLLYAFTEQGVVMLSSSQLRPCCSGQYSDHPRLHQNAQVPVNTQGYPLET
jgi:ORF6N domain